MHRVSSKNVKVAIFFQLANIFGESKKYVPSTGE